MEYARQIMKFSLCPLCGYQEKNFEKNSINSNKSTLKTVFNRFWPKKEEHIWLLAVYGKSIEDFSK